MHESDFVKTHRTGTSQRGNFTVCNFLKSFLLKKIKDPFGNCEGKGGRGRREVENRPASSSGLGEGGWDWAGGGSAPWPLGACFLTGHKGQWFPPRS